jgi:hypothetical protein
LNTRVNKLKQLRDRAASEGSIRAEISNSNLTKYTGLAENIAAESSIQDHINQLNDIIDSFRTSMETDYGIEADYLEYYYAQGGDVQLVSDMEKAADDFTTYNVFRSLLALKGSQLASDNKQLIEQKLAKYREAQKVQAHLADEANRAAREGNEVNEINDTKLDIEPVDLTKKRATTLTGEEL